MCVLENAKLPRQVRQVLEDTKRTLILSAKKKRRCRGKRHSHTSSGHVKDTEQTSRRSFQFHMFLNSLQRESSGRRHQSRASIQPLPESAPQHQHPKIMKEDLKKVAFLFCKDDDMQSENWSSFASLGPTMPIPANFSVQFQSHALTALLLPVQTQLQPTLQQLHQRRLVQTQLTVQVSFFDVDEDELWWLPSRTSPHSANLWKMMQV